MPSRRLARRSRTHSVSLALILAAGCSAGTAAGDVDEVADLSPASAPSNGASKADATGNAIHAKGSFSCDFGLPGDVPLDQVAAAIERDRMYMAERPGMQTKQLPIGFDFATGQLYSGGRYLFDKADQATDYEDWVRNDFVLDGIHFLDRPIFLAPDCHAWRVIGAQQLGPIEAQLVVRTERWMVTASDVSGLLDTRWADVVGDAANRGLTAVWLLHDPDDELVQLVYFADRVVPSDPMAPDFASLFALQDGPALGEGLAAEGWTKTFDRTEWILTVWFPFESGDHGEASLWPYSPPFAQPFCGDGVCEVSRGEDGTACSADCPIHCGDAICQPDESTHDCPGDCRI